MTHQKHPGWDEVECELCDVLQPFLVAEGRNYVQFGQDTTQRWTVKRPNFEGRCPHCRRRKSHTHTFLVLLRERVAPDAAVTEARPFIATATVNGQPVPVSIDHRGSWTYASININGGAR